MPGRLSPAEEALLGAFVERLLAAAPAGAIDAIRVFGSRARGDSGPDSDLDVAVELAAGANRQGVAAAAAAAAWDASFAKDLMELGLVPVVVPPPPPGPLYGLHAAIQRDGLTLWERPA